MDEIDVTADVIYLPFSFYDVRVICGVPLRQSHSGKMRSTVERASGSDDDGL